MNRDEVVLRIPAIAADVTEADAMLLSGEIRSGKCLRVFPFIIDVCADCA